MARELAVRWHFVDVAALSAKPDRRSAVMHEKGKKRATHLT